MYIVSVLMIKYSVSFHTGSFKFVSALLKLDNSTVADSPGCTKNTYYITNMESELLTYLVIEI